MKQRRVSILGSTGSIGIQALEVAALHPERIRIAALTAHRQSELLFEQVRTFRPEMAGLTGCAPEEVDIPEDLRFCDFRFGPEALLAAAGDVPCDDVLDAVVGMAGLPAVLRARQAGRRVLLANKEALVAGGSLVMRLCEPREGGPTLIPVDSEHSAIWQCLEAAHGNPLREILLTASGGPFRQYDRRRLETVTVQDALNHPNWSMGAKITVDSASMFNKALEIIEARWLFSVRPEQIRVLIHPQSVVHSMVAFEDGAVLAQLGVPSMRVPIAYAMTWPDRVPTGRDIPDFGALGNLTFEDPDMERFPALALAYRVLEAGGCAPCVLNAANETANAAFRSGQIGFMDIERVVRDTLDALPQSSLNSLGDVLEADRLARARAGTLIERMADRK